MQAAYSTGPETLNAEAAGYVRLAMFPRRVWFIPSARLQRAKLYLKSQTDLVTRFMKAYVEGIHRFKTDKSAALAILEKYTKQKSSPSVEKIYEIYATKYIKRAPKHAGGNPNPSSRKLPRAVPYPPASRRNGSPNQNSSASW